MIRLILIVILALHASAAFAAEVIGTITGTLDGAEKSWYVTSDDNTSQSDWTGGDNYPALTIFGHATNDNTWNSKGALIISFSVPIEQLPMEFQDGEVIFVNSNMADSFISSRDLAPPKFTITSMQVVDGKLAIKGTFAAKLFHSSNFGRDMDPDNTKMVEGVFETTLPRK